MLMSNQKITVLCDPIPYKKDLIEQIIKRFYLAVKGLTLRLFGINNFHFYRGHKAVTRSLLTGLKELNVSYEYNPYFIENCTEIVIVLSGIKTLKQALLLKKSGRIKKLVVGPNVVVFPSDFHFILNSCEINFCIFPSDWVLRMFENQIPDLTKKSIVWPAGVDVNFWTPVSKINTRKGLRNLKLLIYLKSDNIFFEGLIKWISSTFNYVDFIEYGNYKPNQYLSKLRESDCLIMLGGSESQGLALVEAWSCNVPTFVYSVNELKMTNFKVSCSSAPYLSCHTGVFFNSLLELQLKLESFESFNFTPRNWVLDNLTDSKSVEGLLKELALN
jgi:hypothetical protein